MVDKNFRTMDNEIPHMLGLDLVRQIEHFTTEVVESIEEDFTWLNEILETAKVAFQTSDIQTLPKTPSTKKRRKRKKSEVPSFIRRSSVFSTSIDQTLNETGHSGNLSPRLNSSHSYCTRSTRSLRSRQKADAERNVCNTSLGLTKRNQYNGRKNNSRLSPTEEVPQISVDKRHEEKRKAVEPKEVAQTKIDVNKDDTGITKDDAVTEQSSPVVKISSVPNEASPLRSENVSLAKVTESLEVSDPNPNAGESRVNNNSYVIETPSEEESNLNIPVITASPVNVPALLKPEATDTDSGITSDDKERMNPQQETSEHSDAKRGSEADTASDGSKPSSSSAVSSEEASQPPRTRTRTCQQQQQQQLVSAVQLPSNSHYKESISSTTSIELDEGPIRMTRSRIRLKQVANSLSETTAKAVAKDKPEAPRTRLQKRKSDDTEDRLDSKEKRQCTEAEAKTTQKWRSYRLNDKKHVYPEDADTENCEDDDNNVSMAEKCLPHSFYGTPQNMSSSRSFLLNTSSRQAKTNTPSQKSYSLFKYLSQKTGSQSRLNLISGNLQSLLKRNTTPAKGSTIKNTEQQLDQRKREFEEKRKKEQERLMKRDELQKLNMEERKKKREERMLKVRKSRQLREIQVQELKDKKNKQWEEKLSVTDRIREEKLREEREKLRLRYKKQQEVEERRIQEEEERNKKLREQMEDNQRYQAMLNRKKEFEEEERQRKVAEEKRKFDEQRERMLEAQKEKELERRRKIEEEREQERLKLKEEREKEAARVRIERVLQKEKQIEAEEAQREKLRKLEQERLMYEQQMSEEKEQREQYIANVLSQPSVVSCAVAPLSCSSSYQKEAEGPIGQNQNASYNKATSNHDSYEMTPERGSYNNYDISDLKSDDSTDEEDVPNKPIPLWALGAELSITVLKQYYNCPNLDDIFFPIEVPDLNEFFVKKKARFNKRTSSAIWDSPMLKSHVPIIY